VSDPNDNARSIVFDTFREAALARGLLESDNEWSDLLREAAVDRMPGSLRHLFAWVLLHCAPSDPLLLWQQSANHLSLDYLRHIHHQRTIHEAAQDPFGDAPPPTPPNQDAQDAQDAQDQTISRNAALADINRILIEMDSSLSDFAELHAQFTGQDLQEILDDFPEPHQEPPVAINNHARLNQGQRQAFERIVQAIQHQHAPETLFFVDGPGGTGKSFLYNTLIAHVLDQGDHVISVASSGIAALILHGGRTAHSTFKIPLNINSDSTCNIDVQSDLADSIRNASLLIWDEAPMMHKHIFEAVNRTLKDITKNNTPFGGKVVVFGGDFRQIPPVVPRGTQSQIEQASLRFASFWPHVETLKLTENMRVVQDPHNDAFIQFLLRVGEGREPSVTSGSISSLIRIPDQYVFRPIVPDDPNLLHSAEKHFIRTIYPGISTGPLSPEIMADRVLLTPLNATVDLLNSLATDMTPGQSVVYNAMDCIPNEDSPDAGHYSPEFLSTMNPAGLPPFKLELKVGQPIILIRNMNPARGLCNGTRLIVRHLGQKFIEAEIMVGVNQGHSALFPRVPIMNSDHDIAFPIKFRRTQFPIKPAFAITINKSQGQTLNRVGLHLPQPVFSHGQLYVALSRCTSPQHLKILIENGAIEGKQGTYTRNIVYKRLLSEE